MASRLHSEKNTKTKTKPKRETKTTTTKKNGKTKRVSHLQDVEDMFFGLTCEITSFYSGEIKTKTPIIIYHEGGGRRKNEGGIAWFSGEQRGEKQSLLTEYKGGGL